MPLPPTDLLHASLLIDGRPARLRDGSLRLELIGHGRDQRTGRPCPSTTAEISLHAHLGFDAPDGGLALTLALPPADLGMSLGGAEDDPALRIHRAQVPDLAQRMVRLASAQVRRLEDGRVQVEASGTLGDGRLIRLDLQGRPTHIEVDVLAADGAAQARGLLARVLPQWRPEQGRLEEQREDDAAGPQHALLQLRWIEARWAARDACEQDLAALLAELDAAGPDGCPLLPVGHLCPGAARDGVYQAITDAGFRIVATDIDDGGGAPATRHSAVLQWRLPERWFELAVPGRPLGLDGPAASDDPKPVLRSGAAADQPAGGIRPEEPAVQASVQAGEHGRWSVSATATLADGSVWRLQMEGAPSCVEARSLPPGGEERAWAMLRALVGEAQLDAGQVERSEAAGGVLVVQWQPGWLAPAQERRRQLAQELARRATSEHDAQTAAEPGGLPAPTPDAPLMAGRTLHALEHGELVLTLDARGRASQIDLELVPGDGRPGEDGELRPSLGFQAQPWPVDAPLGGSWQSLAGPDATEQAGQVSGVFEAWFGNDAPELLSNRLAWRAMPDGRAQVRWQAEYEDGHPSGRAGQLVFDGAVELRVRRA